MSTLMLDLIPWAQKHVNKRIIAHLNINSLRNKFGLLAEFTRGKVDILMISETKIDETFPLGQFKINGIQAWSQW